MTLKGRINSRLSALPPGPPSGIHTMKREPGDQMFFEKSGHAKADYALLTFYKERRLALQGSVT